MNLAVVVVTKKDGVTFEKGQCCQNEGQLAGSFEIKTNCKRSSRLKQVVRKHACY